MQPSPRHPEDTSEANASDLAVEEAIAEHGGDAREAIKVLLGRMALLEAARDRILGLVSFGYARGKVDGAR